MNEISEVGVPVTIGSELMAMSYGELLARKTELLLVLNLEEGSKGGEIAQELGEIMIELEFRNRLIPRAENIVPLIPQSSRRGGTSQSKTGNVISFSKRY